MTVELSKDSIQSNVLNDTFNRIGAQLRSARKAKDLRLADVAQELRISVDYLRLLEAGDFGDLPAPAYVSGFLRSYGSFVGLDPATLASRYYLLLGDAAKSKNYKLPMTARAPQRSAPAVASVCIVLALIAYGSWYALSGSTTPGTKIETKLAVVDLEGKSPETMEKNAINKEFDLVNPTSQSLPLSVAAKNLTGGEEQNAEATLAATVDLATSAVNSSLNKPSALTASSELKSSTISEIEKTLSSNREKLPLIEALSADVLLNEPDKKLKLGRAAAIAGLRNPDLEITIRAKASSWVEVVRDDGESVLTKLMKAGETYVIDDGTNLYLSTGNAGGIELVTHENDIIEIGAIGEIVRDLPLTQHRIKSRF